MKIFLITACAWVAFSCGSTARTYKKLQLNTSHRYAWFFHMRTGVDALSYDFHYLDITEDSIYFGPIYNRQGFGIEEIQSVARIKTTKNRSTATAMAITVGLIGAIVGGVRSPKKEDDADCDECGWGGLAPTIDYPRVSGTGLMVGLAVGAVSGAVVGHIIESGGAVRRKDVSSMPARLKVRFIQNLKERGWPASEKDLLR